jgi:hypothetical protein
LLTLPLLLLLLPCSDIIHYANRKLKVYKGNLSKFVEAVPEAQSYYALEATEQVGAAGGRPSKAGVVTGSAGPQCR